MAETPGFDPERGDQEQHEALASKHAEEAAAMTPDPNSLEERRRAADAKYGGLKSVFGSEFSALTTPEVTESAVEDQEAA
jgi:hypothetical protein